MPLFESEPSIHLYAYFDYKAEFLYECETYDSSALIILEEGSFHFKIDDGETLLAQPNSIVYCPPNHELHRKALSPMKLHMLRFSDRTFDRPLYSITPRIKSNLSYTNRYGMMFDPAPYPILIHYCKDIIYAICNQVDTYYDIASLRAYMDENFNRSISNKELCQMMHCSEVSLISRFKNAVGTTPQQYLTQRRLQYAKQLLLNTEKSHQEIAFDCGFSDPLYFSRIFSKHNGISPTEYKRQFRL